MDFRIIDNLFFIHAQFLFSASIQIHDMNMTIHHTTIPRIQQFFDGIFYQLITSSCGPMDFQTLLLLLLHCCLTSTVNI